MTFTYPLDFPDELVVSTLNITPRDAVSRNESPSSFEDETYDWGGEMWTLQGSLPLLTVERASAFQAFLLKLKGRRGTFLYPMQNRPNPLGGWVDSGGGILIDGVNAAQQHTLNLKGFQANQPNAVALMDYINRGTGATTRLHVIVGGDTDADADGKLSVEVWPALRTVTVDGEAIVAENCKGLFRLPKNYGWDIDINKLAFHQFGALEVV